MNKKIKKNEEFDHFDEIAEEWWLPDGKYKILHNILPIRMKYILNNIDNKKIKNLDILDIGCGGGLTCEPLARLGANITGVDFVKKNIEIAKEHADTSNLKIKYLCANINSLKIQKKYDVILILEVLEHIEDWQNLIHKIKKNLKPKGKLIISTINKNHLSKFFGIFFAENILKWIPKNTHNYDKLIKTEKLKLILIKNKFKIINIEGMNYNIITREWNLSKKFFPINYFCTAELI